MYRKFPGGTSWMSFWSPGWDREAKLIIFYPNSHFTSIACVIQCSFHSGYLDVFLKTRVLKTGRSWPKCPKPVHGLLPQNPNSWDNLKHLNEGNYKSWKHRVDKKETLQLACREKFWSQESSSWRNLYKGRRRAKLLTVNTWEVQRIFQIINCFYTFILIEIHQMRRVLLISLGALLWPILPQREATALRGGGLVWSRSKWLRTSPLGTQTCSLANLGKDTDLPKAQFPHLERQWW